jgi:hypothetical protein
MTKVLTVLIIVAALFGMWELWVWYDRVEHEKEEDVAKAKAALVQGNNLQGMPWQLETEYNDAVMKGSAALKAFLAKNNARIEDPRKAWIELDYCVLIARENPAEAKRIFADVKGRTSPDSKVWKRIGELAKTFE